MAYKDFTTHDLREKFGINGKQTTLFRRDEVVSIPPSEWLQETLAIGEDLKARSEKAKSEIIVMPILFELKRRNPDFFIIHSGDRLNVDSQKGLNGECDFLLARKTDSYDIDTPIISVVEAKKNDMELGVNQCAAQMYGAKLYNEKYGSPLDVIYGCVTTADNWKFLKLEDNLLITGKEVFYMNELDVILGIFQHIIDYYKAILEPVEA